MTESAQTVSRTRAGTRRPRSPKGQGDRLRHELLEATGRLLEQHGSEEALSLRAVAREVGIAPPSIYLHFADKTELVYAALASKHADLVRLMDDAAVDNAGAEPVARLRAQVHAYCRFAVDNPGHYRLMYATTLAPVPRERLRDHPTVLVLTPLRQAISQCDESGFQLRLPPERAVLALWSGLHGAISLWRAMPAPIDPSRVYSLADDLVDLMFTQPLAGRG